MSNADLDQPNASDAARPGRDGVDVASSHRRPRSVRTGVSCIGAGLLVAASMPPWGWWPLAWVGIAWFAKLSATGDRRSRAARAWLFAAGWMAPATAWMWFLTAPGYPVAVAIFAGYHALAAAVSPTGRWRVLAQPAAHTVAEALRFCFPFGGIPLASLAISQVAGPLAVLAPWGGAVLITWATFQLGWALGTVRARSVRRNVLALTAGVLVLAVAGALPDGTRAVAGARPLRIAFVQGGGPQGTRAIHSDSRVVVERHLAATAQLRSEDHVDLVVWPENVIDVDSFATSREREEITAEAARLGAPFLVGITEEAVGTDSFLNAQVAVLPDGSLSGRYDKVRRVPFGEYMPMRSLLSAIGAPTDLVPRNAVAGTGPAVVDTPVAKVAVVISWEVFFGGRARDGTSKGGEILINPTNGSSYTGTILQTQQVASSRLRARETGRWEVQVAPTGFSAFVSPDGTVSQRTGVSERAVRIAEIERRTGRTPYNRMGDKPFVALAAVAIGLAAVLNRRAGAPRPAR